MSKLKEAILKIIDKRVSSTLEPNQIEWLNEQARMSGDAYSDN